MKILAVDIDWHEGAANSPVLNITVDKTPTLKYIKVPLTRFQTLYFGQQDGYVHYLLADEKDKKGFGGVIFNLTLVDGTGVTLKGPWSSRASVVNKMGLGPCVDVHINEKGRKLRFSGAVTLEFARAAILKLNSRKRGKQCPYLRGTAKHYMVDKKPWKHQYELTGTRMNDNELRYDIAVVLPGGALFKKGCK